MPDRSHQARHRAGRPAARSAGHTATSTQGRVIAGLALPTAATVALMFCATGAAVATSPKTQSVAFGQSTATTASPQPDAAESAAVRARLLAEVERVQAVARAEQLKVVATDLAAARAKTVARSLIRKRIAVATAVAKRAALAHSWRLPITNPQVTSGYGYRWGRLHAGEDFAVDVGTPLAAMSSGRVVFAGQQSGFGNLVQIRYWDGTISYYGHMSRIQVNVGDAVEPGHIVGESGNTGHSTGPHLHLEIHPGGGAAIDPLPWLTAHKISFS